MKYLKMLGLSMVAAIAAMAFVGAASASASTALCKVNELPCSAANTLGAGTAIEATLSSEKAVLKSSLGNVECKKSGVKGTTTSGLAATLTGEIESVTFGECTLNGGACTVETVAGSTPYPASLLWTEGTMNGVMTVEGVKQHVTCGALINCTFGGTVKPLTVIGGSPASVEAKEVPIPLKEGGLCPSEAKWTAKYKVTNPTALWVSS